MPEMLLNYNYQRLISTIRVAGKTAAKDTFSVLSGFVALRRLSSPEFEDRQTVGQTLRLSLTFETKTRWHGIKAINQRSIPRQYTHQIGIANRRAKWIYRHRIKRKWGKAFCIPHYLIKVRA